MKEVAVNKFICFSTILLFSILSYGQPKDIWVNWECDMEIEILSGRFNFADTVAARGDFIIIIAINNDINTN
jgi:hypothetical protein